jgi:hypothetical protein
VTAWGYTLSSEEHGPAALVAQAQLAEGAGAAKLVRADDIRDEIICGPDPEPMLEAIRSYEAAGLDHIHVHQVGPDQERFVRFWEREIRPKL